MYTYKSCSSVRWWHYSIVWEEMIEQLTQSYCIGENQVCFCFASHHHDGLNIKQGMRDTKTDFQEELYIPTCLIIARKSYMYIFLPVCSFQ